MSDFKRLDCHQVGSFMTATDRNLRQAWPVLTRFWAVPLATREGVSLKGCALRWESPKHELVCALRAAVEPSWWRFRFVTRWAPPSVVR